MTLKARMERHGMTFAGLTLARQLRRELADAPALSALGFTRSHLALAAVTRSLVAGLAAAFVAGLVTVFASPFGPVGIAGRLEYGHPIRFDWVVLAVVCIGTPVFFAAIAALSVVGLGDERQRNSRRVLGAPLLGPVPRIAVHFARGWSPRLAGAVGGIAIGVTVAAGVVAPASTE